MSYFDRYQQYVSAAYSPTFMIPDNQWKPRKVQLIAGLRKIKQGLDNQNNIDG